jgi:hypothetical protein
MFRQEEDGGLTKIRSEGYEFLDNISDTVKFRDQDSNIHVLTNTNNDLSIESFVSTEDKCADITYKYEVYTSYYQSNIVKMTIGIQPAAGFFNGSEGNDYSFRFIINNNDSTYFYRYGNGSDNFENNFVIELWSAIEINDSLVKNGTLKIQKSTGILSLNTKLGNSLTLIED